MRDLRHSKDGQRAGSSFGHHRSPFRRTRDAGGLTSAPCRAAMTEVRAGAVSSSAIDRGRILRMTRRSCKSAVLIAFLGALIPLSAARADFEVTGPDGRRILLKDDGSWSYREAGGESKDADRPKVTGEGVLSLERKVEEGPNCRFGLRLTNNTNHEIHNIVPYIAAHRASGILYDTRGLGFFSVKPGNSLYRERRRPLRDGRSRPVLGRRRQVPGARAGRGQRPGALRQVAAGRAAALITPPRETAAPRHRASSSASAASAGSSRATARRRTARRRGRSWRAARSR